MTEISVPLYRLIFELFIYQAEKALGVQALNTIEEFLNASGNNVAEKVKNFFYQDERARQFLEAFSQADDEFAQRVDDDALRQAIVSKPFRSLGKLEKLATELPVTLDDQSLLVALRKQFSEDWSGELTEDQIDVAAYCYRDCLDAALASKCNQLLPVIYRKVSRLQEDTNQIKKDARLILSNTQELLSEIEKQAGKSLGLSSSDLTLKREQIVPDSIPLPSSLFLPQDKLIQELLKTFDAYPWLALIDGAGKGKTQLSVKVFKKFSGISKWVSLRNKDEQIGGHFRDQLISWLLDITGNIKDATQFISSGLPIDRIASLITENVTEAALLVIDDLPDPVEFESFYFELESVLEILISHNVRIATTGQRAFPPFIVNRFHPYIKRMSAPSFSVDDVLLLLNQAGGPSEFLTDGIATWIVAITKGHPSLVIATIKWLEQSNWDYSLTTIDGLISGEPVKEARDYSRRLLTKQLSKNEKDLLYRLSILGDSFTRKQALEIAGIDPKIDEPGDILDYLIGPWLDKLENNKLNVTPLLVDSGKENLRFELKKSIHRLVAKQLTENKVVDASNAHILLMHLWSAEDYLEFGQVLLLMMTSVKTEAQAKSIDWTTGFLLGVKWPDAFDLNIKLIIRASQIRIASLAGKNIFRLNDDLESLIKQADPKINLMALYGVYSITGVLGNNLPPEISIPRSFALLRLMIGYQETLNEIFSKELLDSLPSLIWGQAIQVKKNKDVMLFLNEVGNLSLYERKVLFSDNLAFQSCDHLMTIIPFSESLLDTEKQNWNDVISYLDSLLELPVVQDNFFLKVACVRSRSIVYADYMKNVEKAISLLDTFSTVEDSNVVFLLNYAKGCFASDFGQVDKAIDYFSKAEDAYGQSFEYYRLDNVRRFAIEKSRKKEWSVAKKLFILALYKINKFTLDNSDKKNLFIWDRAELLGELAIVYWNMREYKKFSAAFYGYLMLLIKSKDFDNLRYKEAFNKLGHGFGWFVPLAELGKPPSLTFDGDVYAPVEPGLFGLRRMVLGTYEPPLGFSKAIALSQLLRILYVFGLEKTAWSIGKLALEHYRLENLIENSSLIGVYPDVALLEFVFGDEDLTISYVLLASKFWAAVRMQNTVLKKNNSILVPLDMSLISDQEMRDAQRSLLFLFFVPAILYCLTGRFSDHQIDKKLSVMERYCDAVGGNVINKEEFTKMMQFFRALLASQEVKNQISVDFEVFGEKTLLEMLSTFTTSLYGKLPLKDSFTKQVQVFIYLTRYGPIGGRLLLGFGRLFHSYWLKVSKSQRFALHNPNGFSSLMNEISPNLGRDTIIRVINGVSIALKLRIPSDVMEEIEKFYFIPYSPTSYRAGERLVIK